MKLDVLLVGGGMISQEVILPALFGQRRLGKIGRIIVATRRGRTIRKLEELFGREEIVGLPNPEEVGPDESYPESYKEGLKMLGRCGAVIVATPDHLHTKIILDAIEAGYDCIVEKPLCLKTEEAYRIIEACEGRGRYVYTDYHKRHDLALRACQYKYRRGLMGKALCSYAWIEERREMPLKNFSLWAEQSSSFEYIGCHYVDMFYFITGELPVKVVGFGQKKLLRELGKECYDAVQAIIEWESGAVQYVQTSWVLPDSNPNLTNQGFQLTCTEGEFRADNADRNSNFVTSCGGYERYNPYFCKAYLDWDEPERDEWLGYGIESIVQPINDILRIYEQTEGLSDRESLVKRRELLKDFGKMRALPRQALVATAVSEAVKMSLENGGAIVRFDEGLMPVLQGGQN